MELTINTSKLMGRMNNMITTRKNMIFNALGCWMSVKTNPLSLLSQEGSEHGEMNEEREKEALE